MKTFILQVALQLYNGTAVIWQLCALLVEHSVMQAPCLHKAVSLGVIVLLHWFVQTNFMSVAWMLENGAVYAWSLFCLDVYQLTIMHVSKGIQGLYHTDGETKCCCSATTAQREAMAVYRGDWVGGHEKLASLSICVVVKCFSEPFEVGAVPYSTNPWAERPLLWMPEVAGRPGGCWSSGSPTAQGCGNSIHIQQRRPSLPERSSCAAQCGEPWCFCECGVVNSTLPGVTTAQTGVKDACWYVKCQCKIVATADMDLPLRAGAWLIKGLLRTLRRNGHLFKKCVVIPKEHSA